MMRRPSFIAVAMFVASVLPSGLLLAESTSAQIQVSAVVVANCRLTITPLSFGEYDPLGVNLTQPRDAETALELYCGRNASAAISIDSGAYSIAQGDRRMNYAGNRLAYGLFRDAARNLPWSEGSEALNVSFTDSGVKTVTLYGRIAAAQAPVAGEYSDVVTARVDF